MTDIVKGMARAACDAGGEPVFDKQPNDIQTMQMEDMRAALLWLANNVSDEMVKRYIYCPDPMGRNVNENVRKSIAAAIRAAAGEEGK